MDSNVAIKLGAISVHWYGLLLVVGTLVGGAVATLEAKRRSEDAEHVWNGLIWCIILGFLGARLYHIFSSPETGTRGFRSYVEDPVTVFQAWDGGLAFFGALAGGVIGVLIYTWRHRLTASRWLDIGAPGLVLAQAIGRWANFINQELYGPPTSLPWGLYIAADHRIPRYADLARYPTDAVRFHPTFLYESLWNLGVFALLILSGRRWADRLRDGDLFLAYLLLYGVGRMWIEQLFRPDAWRVGGGLAVGSLISLTLVLTAGLALLLRHRGLTDADATRHDAGV